jgi:hypothetical protein
MDAPLAEALKEIEAWVSRGKPPSRHHARAILVGLGLEMLDEPELTAAGSAALERVAGWIARSPEAWREAIASEISMAATEHVRSADPRWLRHPQYDLAYAVEARHRLEARLVCAERLGVGVPDEILEAIGRADALLAPLLDDGGKGSAP